MNKINKLKTDSFVLVTVPHAVCPKTPKKTNEHLCDYRSKKVAQILERILKSNSIPYRIITSSVLRSNVDVNRDIKQQSINKDSVSWKIFNTKIQDTINANSQKNILLLDLHSFDKIDSFCKKGETDCFITILDIYNKKRIEIYDFAKVLSKYLNFTVNVGKGGTNYIINTYGNINVSNNKIVYPMLLEFFEDNTLTNEQIDTFLNLLLSDLFISKIFS
jgi:hypothetical protein